MSDLDNNKDICKEKEIEIENKTADSNEDQLRRDEKKDPDIKESKDCKEDKKAETEDTKDKDERPSENTTSESEVDKETTDPKEKKGIFNKKKDKRDEQIDDLNEKLKRQMAEFENFRKRTEKEKSTMYDFGAKDVIEKFLPIVDNFERAIETECADEAFKEGIDKIYRMMVKNLEEAGVKPMDAEGKEFDPNMHNAVQHIEDESLGENIVAKEYQKGYMYKDTVLRHSMVIVAN